MTTINLYQQYLVADMLTKRLESIGVAVTHTFFSKDYAERGTAGVEVSIGTDYHDTDGKWMGDEDREAKVNEFITRYSDATVERRSEYGGKPEMVVRGVSNLGIAWDINFHNGVCEQIQVGTKRVERVDMDAYQELPKVWVDEPVYEYLCPDPIALAGLVSA